MKSETVTEKKYDGLFMTYNVLYFIIWLYNSDVLIIDYKPGCYDM